MAFLLALPGCTVTRALTLGSVRAEPAPLAITGYTTTDGEHHDCLCYVTFAADGDVVRIDDVGQEGALQGTLYLSRADLQSVDVTQSNDSGNRVVAASLLALGAVVLFVAFIAANPWCSRERGGACYNGQFPARAR